MALKTINFDQVTAALQQRRAAEWMEQGYCPAKLPPIFSGTINGWRGSRDGSPVVCEWEARFRDTVSDGKRGVIAITKGGSTGWEGWYIDHPMPGVGLIAGGLLESGQDKVCACAGSDRYEELWLDAEQLREVCRRWMKLERFPEAEA